VTRVAVVVAVVAAVAAASAVLGRRRRRAAPTQGGAQLPTQLDRGDFAGADAPWLVAVFTSASCATCADVVRKAEVLACGDVAVREVEFGRDRALHARYAIDAVPATVVADARGVVRWSVLGPVTATDLWAAMARCRSGSDPGPGPCSATAR
jgi:hypothetical protein